MNTTTKFRFATLAFATLVAGCAAIHRARRGSLEVQRADCRQAKRSAGTGANAWQFLFPLLG